MIPILRDYQEPAVAQGLYFFRSNRIEKPRLIVAPTAAGKSIIIAAIAHGLNEKVLVIQPSSELLIQNFNKYILYDQNVSAYSASVNQKRLDKVVFATIGSIVSCPEIFKEYKFMIMDECFPPGTLVDGNKIESLQIGDLVNSFNHKTGSVEKKKVLHLFKKQAQTNLVKVTLSDGTSFVCTDNHPIFTKEYGYISPIQMLINQDRSYSLLKHGREIQDQALCSLQNRNSGSVKRSREAGLLQPSMHRKEYGIETSFCNSSMPTVSQRSHFVQKKENRLLKIRKRLLQQGMFQQIQKRNILENHIDSGVQERGFYTNEEQQSYGKSGKCSENGQVLTGANIPFSRRQRSRHQATINASRSNGIPNGISRTNRSRKRSISVSSPLLQSRFGGRWAQISNRGGWKNPQVKEVDILRQEENRNTEFVRLDSIEVYERGSRIESELLHGENFVYNIEVEDNHNYFVENTLVHNCHLYPPGAESMFGKFIDANPQLKILGFTATPFRPKRSQTGTQLSMMHNSHIFKGYQHIIQIQDISEKYWAKIDYVFDLGKVNVLQVNTTRAEFTEKSLMLYEKSIDRQINETINKFIDTPMLIFVTSVDKAQELARKYPGSGFVCGKTKKAERKKIIDAFKCGKITRIFNVGVLGVGFDYPELVVLVDAVPTLSLAKHYQKVGRLTRPHPLGLHIRKFYIDLAGNTKRFGYMEDLEIRKMGTTYHVFSKHRKLTSEYVDQMDMNDGPETKKEKFENVLFQFGKHKGKRITECPDFYLSWAMDNINNEKLVKNIKIHFKNKAGEVQIS